MTPTRANEALSAGKPRAWTHLLGGRVVALVGVVALAVVLVGVHLHISNQSSDYTGGLAMLDRLFDIFLATSLLTICFCLGHRCLRLFSISYYSASEELVFSVMTGAGLLGLAVFGLGVIGLLNFKAAFALVALIAAASCTEARVISRIAGKAFRVGMSSRATRIAALVFAVLFVLLLIRTLAPPLSSDEMMCQLAVPKLYVQRGRVYPLVDNSIGDSSFIVQMIYSLSLLAKSDISAKLFSLGLALISGVSLYAFCLRFLSRAAGLLAFFAFFGAGMVFEVAITAGIDLTLAGTLFLATYSMIVYFEEHRSGWLCLSALLAGFSLGIRYEALGGVIFLLFLLAYEKLRRRTQLRSLMVSGGLYLGIVAATTLPWLAKNAVWFHNPIYPYVTGQAVKAGHDSVRYYSQDDDRKLDQLLAEARREIPDTISSEQSMLAEAARQTDPNPLKFWRYFSSPDPYNRIDNEYSDPNYLFILVPLFLFLARPRWLTWLAVSAVFYLLCATVLSWTAIDMLPVYPALTLIAVYTLQRMAAGFSRHVRGVRYLPAMLIAICLFSVAMVSVVQIYRYRSLTFITGGISRRDYLGATYDFYPVDFINRELPANAKILLIGPQSGYHLERDYLADAEWTTNEWGRLVARSNSLNGISQELKAQGIEYILYSPDALINSAAEGWGGIGEPRNIQAIQGVPSVNRLLFGGAGRMRSPGTGGYNLELRNWATFSLYRREFTEPIKAWKVGDFHLLKIR